MPLALWVLALVGPVVKKVLVALGVGVVTYASLNYLGAQISNSVQGAWGAVSGPILQIISLAGLPDCIGITLGAINARIALIAVSKFGQVAGS